LQSASICENLRQDKVKGIPLNTKEPGMTAIIREILAVDPMRAAKVDKRFAVFYY